MTNPLLSDWDTPFALPPSGRLSAGISSKPFYDQFGWDVTDATAGIFFLRFLGNLVILNSLITASPEKLRKMGEESRKLAEAKFDEDLVLRKYEAVVGLAVHQAL